MSDNLKLKLYLAVILLALTVPTILLILAYLGVLR